jgi:glycosyltransferase involved in cell wall biosynthesis
MRTKSDIDRLLIVTYVDHGRDANQRTHHLVDYLREHCREVVVIYRAGPVRRSRRGELLALMRLRLSWSRSGNVRTLRVDPPFNYTYGLGMRLLGYEGVDTSIQRGPRGLLGRLLRGAGGLRHWVAPLAVWVSTALAVPGRFDVCISEGPWETCLGYLLRRLGRVRLLVYEDVDYLGGEGGRLYGRATAALEIFCGKRADMVVAAGNLLARLREHQTGRRPIVIHNGVDYKAFASARDRGPHPPTLIYTGMISDWSALDVAIAALPRIRRAVSGIRLFIVGTGISGHEEWLRGMAEELGVDEQVHFFGRRPYQELPAYLREADVGLANFRLTPFRTYAFPLKVVEYMAAGLPVIGTKGSETEQVITDYGCGVAIDCTPEAFADAVIALLGDRARYEEMAARAREVSAAFDWERLLEREYACIRAGLARVR